jgi:hypothetical protein
VRLFAITPQGLLGITISVIGLWCCLAMEKTTVRRANQDLYATQIAMARLREQAVPVSRPSNTLKFSVSRA